MLAACNANKLETVKKEILEAYPEGKLSTLVCDLSDLRVDSFRDCIKGFKDLKVPLNYLILVLALWLS